MLRLLRRRRGDKDLEGSQLYNQDTFYKAFLGDLHTCRQELIIESPFITAKRMRMLVPTFRRLRQKGVHIVINTRNPIEHDGIYQDQATNAVIAMQSLGIMVLYTGGHHRKLAIIDRQTVWEGSLNILSFSDSCEIMRRMTSPVIANQLLKFIAIDEHLNTGV